MNFIIHRGDIKDPGPDESFIPAMTPDSVEAIRRRDDLPIARCRRGRRHDPLPPRRRRLRRQLEPRLQRLLGHARLGRGAQPQPIVDRSPVRWADLDVFGPVFEVDLVDGAPQLAYIIHRGDTKDPGPDQFLTFDPWGYEVWQLEGEQPVRPRRAALRAADPRRGRPLPATSTSSRPTGCRRTPSCGTAGGDPSIDYELCHAPTGGMTLGAIRHRRRSVHRPDPGRPVRRPMSTGFLHLAGMPTLKIGAGDLAIVPDDPDRPDWRSRRPSGGACARRHRAADPRRARRPVRHRRRRSASSWDGGVPTLELWAPTAKNVTPARLRRRRSGDHIDDVPDDVGRRDRGLVGDRRRVVERQVLPLRGRGVRATRPAQVEHNLVTDPYSVSLSMNSTRSQIVDLSDPALEPAGWDALAKPDLAPTGGHLDLRAPRPRLLDLRRHRRPAERGTYKAFTDDDSNGMEHLAELGRRRAHPRAPAAGVRHRHDRRGRLTAQEPDPAVLATYPPDSDQQQAAVTATADLDGFNWGYDPFHYTTPEGSYSTDPDGSTRIVEFREMVQSLNENGLRVVMDVVYNHTNASGQADTLGARPDRARLLPPAQRRRARWRPRPAAPTRPPSTR